MTPSEDLLDSFWTVVGTQRFRADRDDEYESDWGGLFDNEFGFEDIPGDKKKLVLCWCLLASYTQSKFHAQLKKATTTTT